MQNLPEKTENDWLNMQNKFSFELLVGPVTVPTVQSSCVRGALSVMCLDYVRAIVLCRGTFFYHLFSSWKHLVCSLDCVRMRSFISRSLCGRPESTRSDRKSQTIQTSGVIRASFSDLLWLWSKNTEDTDILVCER